MQRAGSCRAPAPRGSENHPTRPGPAREAAATSHPWPGRPEPAYLVAGGSVHGVGSRKGPALVSEENAAGRFLHGPPLGSRLGSGPPPLAARQRHRVGYATGRGGGPSAGRLRRRWQLRGRDHLGRKPRRAQKRGGVVGNGGVDGRESRAGRRPSDGKWPEGGEEDWPG